MKTRYSHTLNSQVSSINTLLNKYGHRCTVTVPGIAVFQSRIMVATFGEGFEDQTLIISPKYKVYLKHEQNGVELTLGSSFTIEVNGVVLTPLVVKKLTPDAANAIVYLLECTGNSIPADIPSFAVPTVVLPENSTENYPSTTDSIGWSISVQSSNPVAISGAIYIGTVWQIATDNLFTNIVVETTKIDETDIYWTTPYVLDRDTTYYIRCKHFGEQGIESVWSGIHVFSLDLFAQPPSGAIAKPSFTNVLTSNGYLLSSKVVYEAPTNRYFPRLVASTYDPISAGQPATCTIEIKDSTGTVTIISQTKTPADTNFYDVNSGFPFSFGQLFPEYPYVLEKHLHYQARVKYTSVDNYESEWSDVFTFMIDQADTTA